MILDWLEDFLQIVMKMGALEQSNATHQQLYVFVWIQQQEKWYQAQQRKSLLQILTAQNMKVNFACYFYYCDYYFVNFPGLLWTA